MAAEGREFQAVAVDEKTRLRRCRSAFWQFHVIQTLPFLTLELSSETNA